MTRIAERTVSSKSRQNLTAWRILAAASFCHFLNDMMQSLLPAIYPLLKTTYNLNFGQIGLVTFAYQIAASMLQPIVGRITDSHPRPFSLPLSMLFTCIGIVLLSLANSYAVVVLAACSIGVGSAIFHPESSRVARLASGGRHGLAQSIFQVGGNAGSAAGPLVAALLVIPHGQPGLLNFASVALIAGLVLFYVGNWYKTKIPDLEAAAKVRQEMELTKVVVPLLILGALIFSKYFYLASLTSYYTFFLIKKFALTVGTAQIYLFLFLAAVAAGTIAGGPIGDRIGRKAVIWWSILGVLPFTLALPYANLFWTVVLSMVIGLIIASAFSAILVYAQELVPNRVGTISGLFFGFAFGMAGIGAALLGLLADHYGIYFVYQICSYLPAIGILARFLPDLSSGTRIYKTSG